MTVHRDGSQGPPLAPSPLGLGPVSSFNPLFLAGYPNEAQTACLEEVDVGQQLALVRAEPPLEEGARPMMVLVVEDDHLIAMDMEATLFDAGYAVRGPASTAARAIDIVELGPVPDAAFVDVNLRDGRGKGIALARDLDRRWGIPSIFVTGQVAEVNANRDAALGCITKPYAPEVVLGALRLLGWIIGGRVPMPEDIPAGLDMFQESVALRLGS